MDFEAQRKKRMEDIEQKRKRLEEMRKMRKDRTDTPPIETPTPAVAEVSRADVDTLVSSLLGTSIAPKEEPPAPPPAVTPVISPEEMIREKAKKLSIVANTACVSIMPQSREVYHKETQTEFLPMFHDDDEEPHSPRTPSRRRSDSRSGPAVTSPNTTVSHDEVPPVPLDVAAVVESQSFQAFLSSTSKLMERAMIQSSAINLFSDYTADKQAPVSTSHITATRAYEHYSIEKRPIYDIQRSPHYDLIAVAYGRSKNEDNGMVAVWSELTIPEFVFHIPSPALSVKFHPEEAHTLLVACYNGQVLLLDTRTSRVAQQSNISGKAHKHPIYAAAIVKLNMSNTFISISTDGLLCTWDMARLADPISATLLTLPQDKHKTMNVSCMTYYYDNNDTKIVVGTENGKLYVFTLPYKPSSAVVQIAAHFGLITSLSLHPSHRKSLRDLLLTASVDWTIKLWKLSATAPDPMMEFHISSFDYVCDVSWFPSHISVFSTTTSSGIVSVWDLNTSTVEPVASYKHDSVTTRSMWANEGKNLLVADATGRLNELSLMKSMTELKPGDENRFEAVLNSNVMISKRQHKDAEDKSVV